MIRRVVWDLDFPSHGISARDGRIAGAERGAIHALTSRAAVESLAGEPVVAIACLSGRAIGVVVAGGAGHIGTGEETRVETIFRGLFFGRRGHVACSDEFVHEGLVLTDAPAEHAAVVAVVVHAPLDVDGLPGCVGGDGCVTPVCGGVIVVDADASVVAAGTAASNWCGVEIGPRGDGLENGTFGTCVDANLRLLMWEWR